MRRTHCNRITSQESSQHRGGDSEVDARHLFTNAVDIECAAPHATEFFRNEQELNSQLVGAAHVAHDVDRTLVALIEFGQNFVGQALLGKFFQ